ncbi:MAG TPA: hypothetical protein VM912_05410, partial [Terriglobales bacterium]|nr:hypothetical protein [Terriglobales bacterium]
SPALFAPRPTFPVLCRATVPTTVVRHFAPCCLQYELKWGVLLLLSTAADIHITLSNSSRPENGKSFFVNSQAIPLAVDLISQTRFCAFTTALVAKVPKRLTPKREV